MELRNGEFLRHPSNEFNESKKHEHTSAATFEIEDPAEVPFWILLVFQR